MELKKCETRRQTIKRLLIPVVFLIIASATYGSKSASIGVSGLPNSTTPGETHDVTVVFSYTWDNTWTDDCSPEGGATVYLYENDPSFDEELASKTISAPSNGDDSSGRWEKVVNFNSIDLTKDQDDDDEVLEIMAKVEIHESGPNGDYESNDTNVNIDADPNVSRESPTSSSIALDYKTYATFKARGQDAGGDLDYADWTLSGPENDSDHDYFTHSSDITSSYSHTFDKSGKYTLTCEFTDESGDTDSVSWSINVRSEPDPNVSRESPTSSPITLDYNTNATIKARGQDAGGDLDYADWTLSGPENDSDHDYFTHSSNITSSYSHTFDKSGKYTLTCEFTDESGDTDSVSWSINVDPPPMPDLIVVDGSIKINGKASVNVDPGQSVDIFWSAKNQGDAAAGSSEQRVVWSKDNNLGDGNDVELAKEHLGSMDAGQLHTDEPDDINPITIPSDAVAGTYYIGVIADCDDDVNESSVGEGNNDDASVVPVTITEHVDATIEILGISPDPVTAGQSIDITYRVTNTGNTPHSFGIGSEVYKGVNAGDRVDIAILGDFSTPVLDIQESRSFTGTYDVLSSIVGEYNIRLAVWDGTPGNGEYLDMDAQTFAVEALKEAEIVAFNPPAATSTPSRGNTVTTTVTVKNNDSKPAQYWVGLSFSHDSATASSWPLGCYDVYPQQTGILNPEETETLTFSYTLPNILRGGDYWVCAATWPGFDEESFLMTGDRIDDTRNHGKWDDEGNGMAGKGKRTFSMEFLSASEIGSLSSQLGVLAQTIWQDVLNYKSDGQVNINTIEDLLNPQSSFSDEITKPLVYAGFAANQDLPIPQVPGLNISFGQEMGLVFDLADLLRITPEGQEGWVTVWLDVSGKGGVTYGPPSEPVKPKVALMTHTYGASESAYADYRLALNVGIEGNIGPFKGNHMWPITAIHNTGERGVADDLFDYVGSKPLGASLVADADGLVNVEINVEELRNTIDEHADSVSELAQSIGDHVLDKLEQQLGSRSTWYRWATYDDGSISMLKNHNYSLDMKYVSPGVWFDDRPFSHQYYFTVPTEGYGQFNVTLDMQNAEAGDTGYLYVHKDGRPDTGNTPGTYCGEGESITISKNGLVPGDTYYVSTRSTTGFQNGRLALSFSSGQVSLSVEPSSQTHESPIPVSASCDPGDATVRYTKGVNIIPEDPTGISNVWHDQNISGDPGDEITLKFKGFKSRWTASEVVSRTYTIPKDREPEITVEGNGIVINDGDNNPAINDNTDFGTVTIGNSSNHTFTIYNDGTEDLLLDGNPRVQIDGNNDEFSVSNQPSSPINPGGSETFNIVFSPSLPEGEKNATVSVFNNDSSEDPYNFAIQGVAYDDSPPILTNIVVTGPASLSENSSENYTATAQFDDGTPSNITQQASWSENSQFASMSSSVKGRLESGEVDQDEAVMVTASYTYNEISQEDTISVTIIDGQPVLTVNNGTGGGSYSEGDEVSISADAPADGESFNKWIVNPSEYADNLASATSSNTTFTMPAVDVDITATYESTNDWKVAIYGETQGLHFDEHADEFNVIKEIDCWNGAQFDAEVDDYLEADVICIGGDDTFSGSTAETIEDSVFNDGKVLMINFWSDSKFSDSLPAEKNGYATYGSAINAESRTNNIVATILDGLPNNWPRTGKNLNRRSTIAKDDAIVVSRFADDNTPALVVWHYGKGTVIYQTLENQAAFYEDQSDQIAYQALKWALGKHHPADENEDWRLLMSETIGYIAGWQNGDNPMDYAIRGAYIWQNGEEYECDNTKDEPLCWVLATDGLIGEMAETPQAASVGNVERTVSSYDVNVEVTPTVGTTAWGYEEYIPEGITPTDITGSNGAWDSENRKISWWGTGDAAIELGYTVSGAPGTYQVSGLANYDGSDQGVTGNTNIVIYSEELESWIDENLPNGETPEEIVMSLEQAFLANVDPTQEFKIDELVLDEEGMVVLKWDNAYGLPNGDLIVQCCTNLSVEQPIWFEISPDVDGVSYDAETKKVIWISSDVLNVESMFIRMLVMLGDDM